MHRLDLVHRHTQPYTKEPVIHSCIRTTSPHHLALSRTVREYMLNTKDALLTTKTCDMCDHTQTIERVHADKHGSKVQTHPHTHTHIYRRHPPPSVQWPYDGKHIQSQSTSHRVKNKCSPPHYLLFLLLNQPTDSREHICGSFLIVLFLGENKPYRWWIYRGLGGKCTHSWRLLYIL